MLKISALLSIALLSACGDIALKNKNKTMGDPILLAALQVGVEGLWQIAPAGSTGFVISVSGAKITFEGKEYNQLASGGTGIYSHATLKGVRIDDDAGRAQVHFLLFDQGGVSTTMCSPDGCVTTDPTPAHYEVESSNILAVDDASFSLGGDSPVELSELGRMTRLTTPSSGTGGEPLTLETAKLNLSGMWNLTDGTQSFVLVVGTAPIEYDGDSFFPVTAGGLGIFEDAELKGLRIDESAGRPQLHYLILSDGSDYDVESSNVLDVLNGYLSLGGDSPTELTELGRMIRL